MVDFSVVFDGMGVDEMRDTLKSLTAEGRAYIKNVADSAKEIAVNRAKEELEEGSEVRVKYKDDVITGTVVEMREKTFSLQTEDVPTNDGRPSRVSRGYHLVVFED
ncbi:MAG: hypothetical protein ACOC1O_00050 [bacterium]